MAHDGTRRADPLSGLGNVLFHPADSGGGGKAVHQSFAVRYASARPVLSGLIGAGIQASRTPAMHEREGAEQGLRYIYKLIDLDALGLGPECLPELVTAAQRMGYSGLNITYPCKQAILPLLDDLTADARALGAVNTVVFQDGRSVGHNTDWWGFAESFRHDLSDVARECVVQFGAGGAGAAVAHALLTLGTGRIDIADTDQGRADRLAEELCRRFGPGRAAAVADLPQAVADADGIVNTTPVGMAKHPGMVLPAELLRAGLWVADIVYFPLETELLRNARALGCRTMGGGGMAVFQAVGAFRLFTGMEPDPERMRRHFQSM
ncbi:shikimate dehydrogenase [Microvirga subterranea]|uniref:Shikimate dehydrogenase (NADP(+)) n=1 Tax=Microvirga subterranea TaxID=186651 RepID=A0A370HMI2_9HYPH|nr:shikimate dehydrogenase [Microvirga subterranea]RDI59560.1 shikimate dehydrogenase [Microvirga subterranea]